MPPIAPGLLCLLRVKMSTLRKERETNRQRNLSSSIFPLNTPPSAATSAVSHSLLRQRTPCSAKEKFAFADFSSIPSTGRRSCNEEKIRSTQGYPSSSRAPGTGQTPRKCAAVAAAGSRVGRSVFLPLPLEKGSHSHQGWRPDSRKLKPATSTQRQPESSSVSDSPAFGSRRAPQERPAFSRPRRRPLSELRETRASRLRAQAIGASLRQDKSERSGVSLRNVERTVLQLPPVPASVRPPKLPVRLPSASSRGEVRRNPRTASEGAALTRLQLGYRSRTQSPLERYQGRGEERHPSGSSQSPSGRSSPRPVARILGFGTKPVHLAREGSVFPVAVSSTFLGAVSAESDGQEKASAQDAGALPSASSSSHYVRSIAPFAHLYGNQQLAPPSVSRGANIQKKSRGSAAFGPPESPTGLLAPSASSAHPKVDWLPSPAEEASVSVVSRAVTSGGQEAFGDKGRRGRQAFFPSSRMQSEGCGATRSGETRRDTVGGRSECRTGSAFLPSGRPQTQLSLRLLAGGERLGSPVGSPSSASCGDFSGVSAWRWREEAHRQGQRPEDLTRSCLAPEEDDRLPRKKARLTVPSAPGACKGSLDERSAHLDRVAPSLRPQRWSSSPLRPPAPQSLPVQTVSSVLPRVFISSFQRCSERSQPLAAALQAESYPRGRLQGEAAGRADRREAQREERTDSGAHESRPMVWTVGKAGRSVRRKGGRIQRRSTSRQVPHRGSTGLRSSTKQQLSEAPNATCSDRAGLPEDQHVGVDRFMRAGDRQDGQEEREARDARPRSALFSGLQRSLSTVVSFLSLSLGAGGGNRTAGDERRQQLEKDKERGETERDLADGRQENRKTQEELRSDAGEPERTEEKSGSGRVSNSWPFPLSSPRAFPRQMGNESCAPLFSTLQGLYPASVGASAPALGVALGDETARIGADAKQKVALFPFASTGLSVLSGAAKRDNVLLEASRKTFSREENSENRQENQSGFCSRYNDPRTGVPRPAGCHLGFESPQGPHFSEAVADLFLRESSSSMSHSRSSLHLSSSLASSSSCFPHGSSSPSRARDCSSRHASGPFSSPHRSVLSFAKPGLLPQLETARRLSLLSPPVSKTAGSFSSSPLEISAKRRQCPSFCEGGDSKQCIWPAQSEEPLFVKPAVVRSQVCSRGAVDKDAGEGASVVEKEEAWTVSRRRNLFGPSMHASRGEQENEGGNRSLPETPFPAVFSDSSSLCPHPSSASSSPFPPLSRQAASLLSKPMDAHHTSEVEFPRLTRLAAAQVEKLARQRSAASCEVVSLHGRYTTSGKERQEEISVEGRENRVERAKGSECGDTNACYGGSREEMAEAIRSESMSCGFSNGEKVLQMDTHSSPGPVCQGVLRDQGRFSFVSTWSAVPASVAFPSSSHAQLLPSLSPPPVLQPVPAVSERPGKKKAPVSPSPSGDILAHANAASGVQRTPEEAASLRKRTQDSLYHAFCGATDSLACSGLREADLGDGRREGGRVGGDARKERSGFHGISTSAATLRKGEQTEGPRQEGRLERNGDTRAAHSAGVRPLSVVGVELKVADDSSVRARVTTGVGGQAEQPRKGCEQEVEGPSRDAFVSRNQDLSEKWTLSPQHSFPSTKKWKDPRNSAFSLQSTKGDDALCRDKEKGSRAEARSDDPCRAGDACAANLRTGDRRDSEKGGALLFRSPRAAVAPGAHDDEQKGFLEETAGKRGTEKTGEEWRRGGSGQVERKLPARADAGDASRETEECGEKKQTIPLRGDREIASLVSDQRFTVQPGEVPSYSQGNTLAGEIPERTLLESGERIAKRRKI
ncbi:hypothetical protein TGPRC2_239290 [Toxoplasma gondii TgCatPRC2]|uniref:Uncharacterized protein n=1 Tax=Toxoplasma gondii TgCatPRC2 TaxID=1130821 RepID=A0A151HA59_TOXGO|nr:hypothetical protein TGPRC2_239290 [Toxoplasma gondii TgCatPRC2]